MTQTQIKLFKSQPYYFEFVETFANTERDGDYEGYTLNEYLEEVPARGVLTNAFAWEETDNEDTWIERHNEWLSSLGRVEEEEEENDEPDVQGFIQSIMDMASKYGFKMGSCPGGMWVMGGSL